jgi:hypothetical protein
LSAGAPWGAAAPLPGSDRTLDMVRGRVVRLTQYTRPLAAAVYGWFLHKWALC